MRKTHIILIFVVSALVIITVVWLFMLPDADTTDNFNREDRIVQTLESLPQRSGDHPPMRLAQYLAPPTNKWFSSLVFSDDSQPIFAHPVSYLPRAGEIELGYPQINSSEDVITAAHNASVSVNFDADRYEVLDYDDLSVTVSHIDSNGNNVLKSIITQGSPFVFFESEIRTELTIQFTDNGIQTSGENLYQGKFERYSFAVSTTGLNATLNESGALEVALEEGDTLSVFIIPGDVDPQLYAGITESSISGTEVNYEYNDETVTTSFSISTVDNKPTLLALLPHHNVSNIDEENDFGEFLSLYGPQKVVQTRGISYDTDISLPTPLHERVQSLSDNQKEELKKLVKTDIDNTTLETADTYFGGKELYRAAQILDIAKSLDLTESADQIEEQLSFALNRWLVVDAQEPRNNYFYYDTTIKGIVGVEPAFGSEQFNDHHFHYGYFIFAAAVMARYDPDIIEQHGDMIDTLIESFAGEMRDEYLPRLRAFDPYTGHSWAAGYSNFADGNNQESSSEAVNAWYAMVRWAQETQNESLERRSLWLYSQEAESARRYWLEPEELLQLSGTDEYEHSYISLVWGAKRDNATFFSPRKQARLGIQLIPMSTGHMYLSDLSPDTINRLLSEVTPREADYRGHFGDYLVMLLAMHDRERALEISENLNDSHIDGANSRSYLYTWIRTINE